MWRSTMSVLTYDGPLKGTKSGIAVAVQWVFTWAAPRGVALSLTCNVRKLIVNGARPQQVTIDECGRAAKYMIMRPGGGASSRSGCGLGCSSAGS